MLGVLVLALSSVAAARAASWPPFVPPPDSLSYDVASTVERVWRDPTFTRTVHVESAPASLAAYDAFIDAPDLTAAAARHLKLANYDVRILDRDWYHADDGHGARGLYRVLVRERTRRVIVSWGSHSGAILGTISGSALTVLTFDERQGRVGQTLTAYVLIENTVAATMARALLPLFESLVDRKLSEGFHVMAKVVEWATSRPQEFCAWMAEQELSAERRESLPATVPACSSGADHRQAGSSMAR